MTTTALAELASGRWTVELAHSAATFRASSLGRTVTGAVPVIEGVVEVADGGLPSVITGSLDLGAISTGNARRDRDLRKPRFLDLDRHPTMTFAADSVTASRVGWSVAGRLTARGATVGLAGDVEVSDQDRSAAVLVGHFHVASQADRGAPRGEATRDRPAGL